MDISSLCTAVPRCLYIPSMSSVTRPPPRWASSARHPPRSMITKQGESGDEVLALGPMYHNTCPRQRACRPSPAPHQDGHGSESSATKTSKLGHDDERPSTKLETAKREATSTFRSRWDLNIAWGPAEPLQWQRLERQQECGHQRCEEGGAQGTKGLSPGQLTPLLLEL